jgi:hypothetical protein
MDEEMDDEEYIHPCDINVGDTVEWMGREFQAIKVEQIGRLTKFIRWNGAYETETTYDRASPASVKIIKRGQHIIEEDLTSDDVD